MAIISSEKIFIDPKEEITFLVDRASGSEKERLIIVVPQSSLLLSSPVSIKILYTEIAKSKKIGIIVTEDQYGDMIARKAGFIVVSKVSQITSDIWDTALSKKLKFIDEQERRKKELLSNLGLIEPVTRDGIKEIKEIELEPVVSKKDIVIEESNIQEQGNLEIIDSSISEEVNSEEQVINNQEDSEVEKALKQFRKPRIDSKIIELDGIAIMAGGDIRSFLNKREDDKIEGNILDQDEMNNERKVKLTNSAAFAGKDFTRLVSKEKGFSLSKLFQRNRRTDISDQDSEGNSIKKAKRQRVIIIVLIIGILSLLGGTYVLAFQASSVDISIKYKKEDVSTSADILVNPNVTEVSLDPVVIPGRVLVEEKVSTSKTGEATGVGTKGTKSRGQVNFYNTSSNQVSFPAGTKIVHESTGNEYVILSDVNLQAGQVNNQVDDAYRVTDVPSEAIAFGEKYNLSSTDANTSIRFTIPGYQSTNGELEVYALLDSSFLGGTSQEFTQVSKANIDALKEKILPELKALGESKLRNQLQSLSGYTLIPETIEVTETVVSSSPKENEESPDKTFSLTVEVRISAYAISNEHLKSVAEKVILDNQTNNEGNVVVDKFQLPQITKVEKAETGYKISISTSGSVGVNLTDEQIKTAIMGKSINDTRSYFDSIEDIEDVRISFFPGFLPESLRFIPNDTARINITTR
jgi:fructose-specific phosphotransferase system component IIB